ncbi:hypothetical protein [Lysobacter firmicutimachus]|uniref:Uncharacterized protein n=1 Tax=Lysobacter firmicutimachus TaxID=1792846 RepID=A0ABU8D1V7_9GAMM
MKLSAWLWIGPGLLALAALATVYHSANETTPAPNAAAPANEHTREDAELQRMRDEIAGLRSQMVALHRSGADARADPAALRQRAEAGERKHEAYLDALRQNFRRETADPSWSPAMTSRLWNAIRADEAMREAARDVECRSTLCRVEIRDGGDARLQKQLPLWSQQFADALPRMVAQYAPGANGRGEMVLYLLGPEPAPGASAKR